MAKEIKATDEKARVKVVKARIGLITAQPFFGALALRMNIREDEKCETMWVDGYDMGYNPEWVKASDIQTVQAAVAQGTLHCGFMHQLRRGNRKLEKWQAACDYAVNGILAKTEGFYLDEKWPHNPAYDGKSAEEIYTLLPDGGDGKGKGQGGAGTCMAPGQQDFNECRDSPACDPNNPNGAAQQKMEEQDWKQNLASAALVTKQQGKLPADIERMIENMLEPVFPWKDVLRRFLTEKLPDETNWNRPNRRFMYQNIYLPSKHSEETGVIVAAIDTSGSIGQKELDEFGGELNGIVQDVRPSKLIVIYCDAAVNHVDEFGPDEQIQLNPHGGGGTDFRPPFDYLEEHNIKPHAFVYLTDGYGAFPEEQDFPVLWAINNNQVVPPHGEHIVLDFDGR